jgi:hypothetical protein
LIWNWNYNCSSERYDSTGFHQSINCGRKETLPTKSGFGCNPAAANLHGQSAWISFLLNLGLIQFLIQHGIIEMLQYNNFSIHFMELKNIVKAES